MIRLSRVCGAAVTLPFHLFIFTMLFYLVYISFTLSGPEAAAAMNEESTNILIGKRLWWLA
jgi:hypothetical protein